MLQVSVNNEKLVELKRAILPLLNFLPNNEIHRYTSLQLALYHLKDILLPHFKFDSKNVWGPADEELRSYLNYLCGLIEFEIKVIDVDHAYGVYRLTEQGKMYADAYIRDLQKNNSTTIESLVKIAVCVSKHQKEKSLKPLADCLSQVK